MITKVVMPKLSDAMETGKVIKWLKKEGDVIKGGDVIAEVETDKANVELEAFGSGVLRKVVVGEGGQVPVGELIAVIAEPADDIGTVVAGASAARRPPPRGAAASHRVAPAPSSGDAAKPADIPPAAAPGPVPHTETYKSAPGDGQGGAARPRVRRDRVRSRRKLRRVGDAGGPASRRRRPRS